METNSNNYLQSQIPGMMISVGDRTVSAVPAATERKVSVERQTLSTPKPVRSTKQWERQLSTSERQTDLCLSEGQKTLETAMEGLKRATSENIQS